MTVFLVYILLVACVVYLIAKKKGSGSNVLQGGVNPKVLPDVSAGEIWKQVYETASMDEACLIRARLAEEGIEVVLYEQGKKDIHGNPLTGIGVAVPGAGVEKAQSIIAKMPV